MTASIFKRFAVLGATAAGIHLGVQFSNSMEAPPQTTPNNGTLALTDGPAAKCTLSYVSYFDDASLARIDKHLASLRTWMDENRLMDITVVEDYLGETAELTAEDQMVVDSYGQIFALEKDYVPGTKEGMAFLKGSDANVMKALAAYTMQAQVMRIVLIPEEAQKFDARFGSSVSRLESILNKTEFLMDGQTACTRKSPDAPKTMFAALTP